jgi:hypothetical protein
VLGTYPLDLLRSRMAFEVAAPPQSLVAAARATWASPPFGLRAVYRGFGPTVAGIVPYAGISFFVYDSLKALRPDHPPSPGVRLLYGALAGAAAQTAAYPLDVLRRRMQVHGLPGAADTATSATLASAAR